MLAAAQDERWQLYRVLADPLRLRLLALAAQAELSVGELASALSQTQPNVSRHAGPLRQAGLLAERRDGTRTLLSLRAAAVGDPVVADAVAEGRRLCDADGSLGRAADAVRARDARSREFFETDHGEGEIDAGDLAATLHAVGLVLPRPRLAVDAGTGDGSVLAAIAPLFERVIAVERSEARLERARARMAALGLDHVELVLGDIDGREAQRAVGPGADVVVAGRMLHHSPVPARTIAALAELLAPGGRLLVVDYAPHEDEAFRDAQADVWMGFEPAELVAWARAAGLEEARVAPVPAAFFRGAPPRRGALRVPWLALVARRPTARPKDPRRARPPRSGAPTGAGSTPKGTLR